MNLTKRLMSSNKLILDTTKAILTEDLDIYAGKSIYKKGGISARDALAKGVNVSQNAISIGKKAAIGTAVGGAVIGATTNFDEGISNTLSGTISGAGLGAVSGGVAGVALAIAKGIR